MALPDWAAAPGPGWTHDDNYSPLEVVWTSPAGDVSLMQTSSGYVTPQAFTPTPGATDTHADIVGRLAELEDLYDRQVIKDPAVVREIAAGLDRAADKRHQRALSRIRRRLIPAVAVTTAAVAAGVHFLPWHL